MPKSAPGRVGARLRHESGATLLNGPGGAMGAEPVDGAC